MRTLNRIFPGHAAAVVFVLILGAATAPLALGEPLLRFTEVVTDPEQDHGESAGGNGIAFDGLPGTGTVSSVDEFIEVFNAGTEAVALAGWRIEFNDSSPAVYEFGAGSSGVVRYSAGSTGTLLQPGGLVLVGNPPGSLNNRIDLRLRAPDGTVADEWSVAKGASTGPGDESILLTWACGKLVEEPLRGPISPLVLAGFGEAAAPLDRDLPRDDPPPVPEPSTWVLLGSAVSLAGLRAIARIVRRGKRRNGP